MRIRHSASFHSTLSLRETRTFLKDHTPGSLKRCKWYYFSEKFARKTIGLNYNITQQLVYGFQQTLELFWWGVLRFPFSFLHSYLLLLNFIWLKSWNVNINIFIIIVILTISGILFFNLKLEFVIFFFFFSKLLKLLKRYELYLNFA